VSGAPSDRQLAQVDTNTARRLVRCRLGGTRGQDHWLNGGATRLFPLLIGHRGGGLIGTAARGTCRSAFRAVAEGCALLLSEPTGGVMDLFGPFLVDGRAISTGLNPQAGDSLSVLASGVLTVLRPGTQAPDSVTADGLVDAMGTPLLAPSGWLNPGLKQLSLVGRVGNQSFQLGSGLTPLAGVPLGGELSLDVNAPPSTEYEEDGWSVYIVRAAAGQPMPRLRDWVFFEDLTSSPTEVSGGIAAAVLGNVIHVFWIGAGAGLNHLTIDPDGVIGPTSTVDPRALDLSQVSAVVHRGAVNVFYCVAGTAPFPQGGALGVLRRGVLNPAGVFDLSDVDGDGGHSGTGGAILGVVGMISCAESSGNDLHVIYKAFRDRNVAGDPGDGLGGMADVLRHARVTISGPEVAEAPYVWVANTIDGAGGGPGQVSGVTGGSIATLVDQAAQVHAFYFVGTITGRPTGGNDLRHAEFDWVGGAAQRWKLETLDGAGRTFANASGQRRGKVGLGTGCLLHNGELHAFYNDMDNANLRWGVKLPTYAWAFKTIDGLSRSPGGRGRIYGPTSNRILDAPKPAVSLGDQISVFYEDRDERVIRHAYMRPGLPWMMEVVDGDTAFAGRVRSSVSRPAAVMRGGFLNLIYYDDGRRLLRHAVLSR
jgi:hypothetical protein